MPINFTPQDLAMFGAAGGLLNAAGPSRFPVGLGQAINQGLLGGLQGYGAGLQFQGQQQQQIFQKKQMELIEQELATKKRQFELQQQLLGQFGLLGPGAGTQSSFQGGVLGQGQTPPGMSPETSMRAFGTTQFATDGQPQQQPQQQFPFTPTQMAGLRLAGMPDLTPAYNAAQPNIRVQDGFLVDAKRGIIGTVPQTNQQGFSTMNVPDGRGGWQTIVTPGSLAAFTQQQQAAEGAKAGFRPFLGVTDQQGRPIPMTEAQFAQQYGGQGAPASAPARPRAAPSGIPAPGQGMGQTAAEKAAAEAAAKQDVSGTPGQQSADREFGTEYAKFKAGGGFSDVEKNINQLEQQLQRLRTEEGLTGMTVGLQPDATLKYTNPQAYSVKQQIEEVVQRNLRLILGGQFAEREGENLIRRAYDPALPQEENAMRINRLLAAMRLGAAAKKSAAEYFEKNGTLRGWSGKLPTINDFMQAVDGGGSAPAGWSIEEVK